MFSVRRMIAVTKGDVRRLPPAALATIASIAVYNFGWGFADPFFALYLRQFADHYATIGILHALMTLTAALVLIPLGAVLNRVAPGRLIARAKIGYALVGLCYFLAGEFQALPLLVVGLILNGLFLPVVWTSTEDLLRQASQRHGTTLTFGLYTTAKQCAWALGLGIALVFITQLPIHYVFIPVIIFPLLSSLIGRQPISRDTQTITRALRDVFFKERIIGSFVEDLRRSSRELWLMFGLYFCVAFAELFTLTFFPLYLNALGFSASVVGGFIFVVTIPFLFSFLAAEVADRSERLRNILFGTSLMALALGSLSVWHTDLWQIFVAGFCVALGAAFALPSLSSIITLLTPKGYIGSSSALVQLTVMLAYVVGSPSLGQAVDWFGWPRTFLLFGCFFTVVTILTLAAKLYFQRRNLVYHINKPRSRQEPFIV